MVTLNQQIETLFIGLLRERTKCVNCNKETNRVYHFSTHQETGEKILLPICSSLCFLILSEQVKDNDKDNQ